MSKSLKDVLARAESWPEWAQNNLADIALEMDLEVQTGTYRATEEELRKIDEALAAVRRGEVATGDEVEAVFAKHRGSEETEGGVERSETPRTSHIEKFIEGVAAA